MTKAFSYTSDGRTVAIKKAPEGAYIGILPEGSSVGVSANLSRDTTLGAALALLECIDLPKDPRGSKWEASLACSRDWLHKAVSHLALEQAEAEEQAKLEEEALELLNQYRIATQLEPIDSWTETHPLAQEQWLAVARRAREINKETGE